MYIEKIIHCQYCFTDLTVNCERDYNGYSDKNKCIKSYEICFNTIKCILSSQRYCGRYYIVLFVQPTKDIEK